MSTAQPAVPTNPTEHIDSEIDILKRKLLQSLSSKPSNSVFLPTKCLLTAHFYEPKEITKLEFAPESAIVRLAADLNRDYYELQQKRQKLESHGLLGKLQAEENFRGVCGFRGESKKNVKPKELFDEELLSKYNQAAQKVWEERLINGVIQTKEQPNKPADPPTNVNLFELDGWRANEAAALDLLKKYKPDSDILNQNRPDVHPLAQLGHERPQERPKDDSSSAAKKPPIATLSDKSGPGKSDPAENLLNKLRGGPSVESLKQAQSPHGSEDMMGSAANIKNANTKSLQPSPRPALNDNPNHKRDKFSNIHELRDDPAEIIEEIRKPELPGRIIKPTDPQGSDNTGRPKSARGGSGGILFTEPVPKPKLLGQDSLIDSASGLQDFSLALKDKSGFGSAIQNFPQKDLAPAQPPVEELSGGAYSMFSASGSGNAKSPDKSPGKAQNQNQGLSKHHAAAKAQQHIERVDETPPSADEFEDDFAVSQSHNKDKPQDSQLLELSRSQLPGPGRSLEQSKGPPKKSGLDDLDLDGFDDF